MLQCYEGGNEQNYLIEFQAPSLALRFCKLLNDTPNVAGKENAPYMDAGSCYVALPRSQTEQKQLMTFLLKNEYTTWEDATTLFDKLDELRRDKGHEK